MSRNSSLLTGSTSRLLTKFHELGIACEVVDGELNLIRHKTASGDWRLLKGVVSEKLSLFSRQMCDDKLWTFKLLSRLNLPTPDTLKITSLEELTQAVRDENPVVVKPRFGAHGNGVAVGVTHSSNLADIFSQAKSFSPDVIVQEQVDGVDVRLLVIGGRIVSAIERRPATVVGDGEHTVEQLIEIENQKPERGKIGIDTLVAISVDSARRYLGTEKFKSVPADGAEVRVSGPSNQSMGGAVHDITEEIPSDMHEDTLKLVSYLNMPIAGVDCIMGPDSYSFLEVNASPGIAVHDDPAIGVESGCFESYAMLLHEDSWWRS